MSAKIGIFGLLVVLVATAALGCAKGEDDEDSTINGNTPGGNSNTTTGGDDDDTDDDTDDDADDDDGIVTVATVFQSSAWANGVYAFLFDQVGWQAYNVLLTDMPETAFDEADLILVDAFTIWQSETADFLAETGLPIIAMGSGGLQLFELMGLESSFANTNGIVFDFQDSFTVPDVSHPVFNEPVDFSEFLQGGDSLDVLNTSADLFGVNLDPLPLGVKVIATREFDESRGGILLEDSKYMSWGLDLSADQLNDNGGALLVNCVAYLTDAGDDFGVE